jgi:hypothetical protein
MKSRHVVGLVLVLSLVAVLFYFYGGSRVPAGQAPLRSLTTGTVAQIKNEFNAAKADVRVLLLLSPT